MIQVTRDEPYIYLSTDSTRCWGAKRATLDNSKISVDIDIGMRDLYTFIIGPVPDCLHDGTYNLTLYDRLGAGYRTKVNVAMQCKLSVASSHTPTNQNAGDTIIECVPDSEGEDDGNSETASAQLDSEGLSA